jgi:hypothetical protein
MPLFSLMRKDKLPFTMIENHFNHHYICSMIRKYLPYIALIGAACLLLWVKTHQRGYYDPKNHSDQTERKRPSANDHQPVVGPAGDNKNREEGFNRNTSHLIYSKHARCRMNCRHIDESEVKEILENGNINYSKIEENARGKSYPLEGITHDRQHVRIVFAPENDGSIVVVTCIDLDREWSCACE